MKVEDAKKRIDTIKANIESKNFERLLDDEDVMVKDSCNELRKLCRNLREGIKNAGCVGREADPLMCQPMWDDLNDAYMALHDCMHPPK